MNQPAAIIDVTAQQLPQLIEHSKQQLVLIDFWADWCNPCKQMAPILERLVNTYQGKLLLAKVNADTEQELAAQFAVRSLPTLKLLYQGQLVSEQTGLQTEAALQEWLAPYLDPEAAEAKQLEDFLEQAKMAIEQGQGEAVEPALRQLLQERPATHAARAVLADWLLANGRLDEAQSLLAEVEEEVPELAPYRARFALLEKLESSESLAVLAERIEQPPASPDDLYQFGLQAAASGRFEEGLDALIVLLRDHPSYKDGAAKAALLEIFGCLPKGNALASEYRRRMFNYLY